MYTIYIYYIYTCMCIRNVHIQYLRLGAWFIVDMARFVRQNHLPGDYADMLTYPHQDLNDFATFCVSWWGFECRTHSTMLIALADSPSLRRWNHTNQWGLAWQSNETSFCLFCSMMWSTQDFIILSEITFLFFQKTTNLVVQSGPTWRRFLWARTFLRMWLDGASSLVIGDGAGCVETLLFYLISRILWDDSLLYSRSLRSFHVKCATNMANIKVYGRSMFLLIKLSGWAMRVSALRRWHPCWFALEFGSLSH